MNRNRRATVAVSVHAAAVGGLLAFPTTDVAIHPWPGSGPTAEPGVILPPPAPTTSIGPAIWPWILLAVALAT